MKVVTCKRPRGWLARRARRSLAAFEWPPPAAAMLALMVTACAGEAAAPTAEDLVGAWAGEPTHGGRTGRLALRIEAAEEGKVTAALALPDLDVWWLPLGPARVEAGALLAGPFVLRHDPGRQTLSGQLPAALVPVHRIPVELNRVESLEPRPPQPVDAPAAAPRWTFDTGAPVWAGLAVAGDLVLAPSDSGVLNALDAVTGRERWRVETGGPLRATPTVVGGLALLHSDDGHLYWIATDDGEVRRRTRLGEATRRAEFGAEGYAYDHQASGPAATARFVFVGHGRDMIGLRAVDEREIWRFTTGGDVLSTPVVHGGRIFFGSMDGHVYAVDARTGDLVWKHDTGAPVPSSPAVLEDRLIIGSRSYDLLALSTATGDVLWSSYYWFSWVESSAIVRDGTAYIGSSDAQMLYALDGSTGQLRWSFDTGGSAWARPAVSSDAVFIGAVGVAGYMVPHAAGFFAVDRATGEPRWQFEPERPGDAPVWGFASSPAFGSGLVFVGGLDGKVHAFRP